MRICFISWEYPTHTGFGGIAYYVKAISELLASKEHTVHIITSSFNKNEEYLVKDSNLDITIHYLSSSTHGIFRRVVEKKLKELTIGIKFDIIEVSDFGADAYFCLNNKEKYTQNLHLRVHGPSLLGLLINTQENLIKFKIKLLLSISSNNFMYKIIRRFITNWDQLLTLNRMELLSANKADRITAPSNICFNFLEKYWKIDTKNILLNNNPVTLQVNEKFNFNNFKEQISIAFIGRCNYLKGIDIFIDAIENLCLEMLNKLIPIIEINILGDISDEDCFKICNKFKEFSNVNLIIHGFQDIEFVENLLQNVDLVIIPSRHDNFPNVQLEAMSKGCLVVTSSKTGTAKLIENGFNGYIFESGNINELKNIISAIMNLSTSELFRISKNAINTVQEEFTLTKILVNYRATMKS